MGEYERLGIPDLGKKTHQYALTSSMTGLLGSACNCRVYSII